MELTKARLKQIIKEEVEISNDTEDGETITEIDPGVAHGLAAFGVALSPILMGLSASAVLKHVVRRGDKNVFAKTGDVIAAPFEWATGKFKKWQRHREFKKWDKILLGYPNIKLKASQLQRLISELPKLQQQHAAMEAGQAKRDFGKNVMGRKDREIWKIANELTGEMWAAKEAEPGLAEFLDSLDKATRSKLVPSDTIKTAQHTQGRAPGQRRKRPTSAHGRWQLPEGAGDGKQDPYGFSEGNNMKISQSQLNQIIKEETEAAIEEMQMVPVGGPSYGRPTQSCDEVEKEYEKMVQAAHAQDATSMARSAGPPLMHELPKHVSWLREKYPSCPFWRKVDAQEKAAAASMTAYRDKGKKDAAAASALKKGLGSVSRPTSWAPAPGE